MTGRYVITLTSVTIVIIICAGTYAPIQTTTVHLRAPAMAPASVLIVLSSAAHHLTTTAALIMMKMEMLLILAAQEAHLPTCLKTVLTVTRGRRAPQAVTTPTNTAETLDILPHISVLMVDVSR